MSDYVFSRIGGRLSLEFLNTVGGMRPDRPSEHLHEYGDLLRWAQAAGLLEEKKIIFLRERAEREPGRGQEALREAIALREALYQVVFAGIRGEAPEAGALRFVNFWIARAQVSRRLVKTAKGFELQFEEDEDDLLSFLAPVALDAQQLLAAELSHVHICDESEVGRCGWLFLDETRNHSRRFCSMRDCGNRAKQRRFRKRVSS
jgi:predicted RNA-binding Zn ribbon-like protein